MIQRSGTMTRMDVINALIQKYNYKSYLEIGCQNNGCFDKIVCEKKIGVDPEKGGTLKMTSDDFFYQNNEPSKRETFDIIFIDGLHHADQVYKDIINSLEILNEGGTIVCHDMIPSSYEAQVVPRQTKHWNGDCWKAFVQLRVEKSDLEMRVIQTDCGLGIIKKGVQELIDVPYTIYHGSNIEFYLDFEVHQKQWLNAISCDEFKQLYL